MQRFGSEHVDGSQTLLRSAWTHFHTIIPLISGRTRKKRLVLVSAEVLGQSVNTMTVVYKYFRQTLKNLPQEVQTLISQKLKSFSGFFIALPKSALNLE